MDTLLLTGSFSCYSCKGDKCAVSEKKLATCENAIYCWKSTNREEDGTESNSRGCFENYMAMRFACKSDSQYTIECCQSELCNGGAFPALQPASGQDKGFDMVVVCLLAVPLIVSITILIYSLYNWDKCKRSRREGHNQPRETNSAINNAATPPAPLSNIASICSSSSHDQVELSTLKCTDEQRWAHNQPTVIESETNNEASQSAGPSNDASISSNSPQHQPELNATNAGGSTLKSWAHNELTEIGSLTSKETSQSPSSSNIFSISSNSPLHQPELNATNAGGSTLKRWSHKQLTEIGSLTSKDTSQSPSSSNIVSVSSNSLLELVEINAALSKITLKGTDEQREAHNQPTAIGNETNNEASQSANSSNFVSISSNSLLELVEINATSAGDITFKSQEHNQPTSIDSETNNEASPPADSSNVAGTCSNSPLGQPKLIVTSADDSTLKTEEQNKPTKIDSETNNEASQSAGPSDDVSISSNSSLEQPELNATPAVYIEKVMVHESHGSLTDITKQNGVSDS